jgi:DNA-directed RNA polymerase subunit beta'
MTGGEQVQVGALIMVKHGQQVSVGEVLARIPTESQKTRDITGGLPRVAELFEARSPKDAGMLAEVTGTVAFGKETKGKQRLEITDMDGNKHEFLITKDKQVLVHDGQVVSKGEMIVDGPGSAPAPVRKTSCACWVSKRWPATSSTKCRTCNVCRA